MPNAIEESLRFDPPVLGDCRTNTAPVTIHGVDIPANSKVMHLLRSANHDPDLCEAPDEFRMDRPLLENRKHYAFGWGTHFCLGAHLARMTARTALGSSSTACPTSAWTVPPSACRRRSCGAAASCPSPGTDGPALVAQQPVRRWGRRGRTSA